MSELVLPVFGASGYPCPRHIGDGEVAKPELLEPLEGRDFIVKTGVVSLREPSQESARQRLEAEGVIIVPQSIGAIALELKMPGGDLPAPVVTAHPERDRLSRIKFSGLGVLATRREKAPYKGEDVVVEAKGWFINGRPGFGKVEILDFSPSHI